MSCFHIDRLFSKADGGTKKMFFFSLSCENDAVSLRCPHVLLLVTWFHYVSVGQLSIEQVGYVVSLITGCSPVISFLRPCRDIFRSLAHSLTHSCIFLAFSKRSYN